MPRGHKGKIQEVTPAVRRRWLHAFTPDDEKRYQTIRCCDWCGQHFRSHVEGVGSRPDIDIDHDHRCCPMTKSKNGSEYLRHCHACLRGFVHRQCNRQAIAYYEWLERTFGVTSDLLEKYRAKFWK